MDLFFAIGTLAFGLMIALVGFKVYNPFKGKNTPLREELWYDKFGTFMKLGGIAVLLIGVYLIIKEL